MKGEKKESSTFHTLYPAWVWPTKNRRKRRSVLFSLSPPAFFHRKVGSLSQERKKTLVLKRRIFVSTFFFSFLALFFCKINSSLSSHFLCSSTTVLSLPLKFLTSVRKSCWVKQTWNKRKSIIRIPLSLGVVTHPIFLLSGKTKARCKTRPRWNECRFLRFFWVYRTLVIQRFLPRNIKENQKLNVVRFSRELE